MKEQQTVLVTGISGFVGAHVALAFVKAGYKVRGACRSQEKADQFLKSGWWHEYAKSGQVECLADLEVVTSDWSRAVKDVDVVVHVASPFLLEASDYERDFFIPAVQGTLNLLKAAAKEPSVKHFVLTSSVSAIIDVRKTPEERNGIIYTEADWNPTKAEECHRDGPRANLIAYSASKAFSEKAAHEFVDSAKPAFLFSTICPSVIFGPIVHPISSLESLNASNVMLWKLVSGEYAGKQTPPIGQPMYVDVRDVAAAHVLAVEKSVTGRFIIHASEFTWQQGIDAIAHAKPELASRLPVNGDYSKALYGLSNEKSKTDLGLQYRPLAETFVDCAEQWYGMQQDASKLSGW